ncbi:MAG: hypothetical protein RL115_110 [Bacteroidota bacterium]
MKRNIFILCLVGLVVGCTKQNTEFDNLTPLTKEVVAQKTIPEIKQAYRLLTYSEKETLWRSKLGSVLKNDAAQLTTDQRAIVSILLELLNKHGMKTLLENPKIGEKLLENNLATWEKHFRNHSYIF